MEEIAADPAEHYETRTSVLEGKAMVVAMSREICVELFAKIIALRPEWAGTKLTKDGKEIGWNPEDGAIRIVMTGSATDTAKYQDHLFSKGQKTRGKLLVFSVQFSEEEQSIGSRWWSCGHGAVNIVHQTPNAGRKMPAGTFRLIPT